MQPEWEQLLDRFDTAWRGEVPPRIEDFLPNSDTGRRDLLEELVKIDLECRWRRLGQSPQPPLKLEEYLARFPELAPLSLSLIGMEYQARHCWGDRPSHEEYAARFAASGGPLRQTLARIDAELAAEFGTSGRSAVLAPAGTGQRPVEPAKPPPATAAALVELLRKHQLLTPPQLDQLTRNLVPRHPQPRALARTLLDKDWLTAFQVNQLLQGRGEELVLGPYILLERLGEGGAGQVFKARHQRLDRLVALKVLHQELLGDADAVSRFYREIKVCSQLDHPNIVRAHDAGPIGSRHCLAMEYIEGIDLARLVKQRGPLPASLAGEFVRQAALGLQYAHERGLIHRDIKPSNLLVTSRSRTAGAREVIKILDFGLARLRRPASGDGAVAGHTTITAVGSVVMMGTPDYLAPEQAINFHEADIRSDIYSLGCTFYYLLTGQPPFPGGTLSQKLWQHQQAPPPDLSARRPDLPPELVAVVMRMLAKQPADRYQSPGEIADTLALLLPRLPGESMTTRLAARWRGLRRRLQNRRRWLIGTAAALVGLGIVGWLLFRDGPTAQAFRDLQARLADLQGDRVLLWRDCLDFRRRYPDSVEAAQVTGLLRQELFDYRRRYPGSPQARQAALLLPQLPSRLDELPGKPGEVVAQPPAGTPPVVSVAFSPDGSLIAAGCEDSTIYLWDPIANQVRTTLKGSTAATPAAVTALAFAPDGDRLVSGSMDGSLVLWDTAKGVELAVLKRYRPQPISLVCFAPDGQTLAVAVRGGRIALWDMAPPYRERLTHEGVGYQINSLSFSPDGQKLAALSATGSGVKVWTVAGQEQPAPKVSKPRALAISPDGRTLMVGGAEDRLLAWDLARSQGAPFELSKAISSIRAMIYTPDGKGLITSHERTLLAMWDAETAVKRLELRLDIHSMALAPDGRHLAVADDARRLTLLRLEMGPRP